MIETITKFANKIIWLSYFALVVITPFIFSSQNSELFEIPKMHFVYILAIIILFSTLVKFAASGKVQIPKSWQLVAIIVFLIFLTFQILSTFFSIDKFTSVFGYPSRLNGGLLSQVAYFIIFAGAMVNFSPKVAQKLIISAVLAALLVSLWGIPAHFGKDPSCLVLTGKLNSTCWQKDFDPTLRIFSTLGQPNWLASYLVLVLPISLVLILTFNKNLPKTFFAITTLIIYTALIFTNSRAGIIGVIIGVLGSIFLLGPNIIKKNIKILSALSMGIIAITLIFGTTLTSRFNEAITKSQKTSKTQAATLPSPSRQSSLTTGGTESGQIRLIVWSGAYEIFLNWPILGSGPETFAYAYYKFRPLSHNQTTEWNFFYNKAHNEFLNYLANIGTLGTLAYTIFILTILVALFRISKNDQLAKAALGGFLGYQATIFFGFSTVPSQITTYLAVALVLTSVKSQAFEINLPKDNLRLLTSLFLTILGAYVLSYPLRFYIADLLITKAKALGQSSRAISYYQAAVTTFPFKNPFYLADLAMSYAAYSTAVEDEKTASEIAQKAFEAAKIVQTLSPNNLILERKAANTYLLISDFDEKYKQNALNSGEKLTTLAPTDPQSYLTFAKVQAGVGQEEEARKSLEEALKLKPDYLEAQELLEQIRQLNN